MLQAVLDYFALVFEVIGYTLRLDPKAYREVILYPNGTQIIRVETIEHILTEAKLLHTNKSATGEKSR